MELKLTHFPYLWISNQAHEWFVNITHEIDELSHACCIVEENQKREFLVQCIH